MLESGEQTCFDDYKNLLSFMANYDLSVEENYNYVCEQIDIKSLIDLYCIQIYLVMLIFHIDKYSAMEGKYEVW